MIGIQTMNLSLINQNIEAQTKAGDEAKRFQTALAALDKACKDNKFKDYADFLDQVAVYEGKAAPAEQPAKKTRTPTTKTTKSSGGTGGKGNKISNETRSAILKDLQDKNGTTKEIAKRHNVSAPYVSTVKSEAGLAKKREKDDTTAPAAAPAPSGTADAAT